MSKYDCKNPLQKKAFLTRAEFLAERGDIVELTSKRARSLRQSAYLHCLFAYFGSQYGEDAEYVKVEYFKKLVNPEFFYIGKGIDRFTGREVIRLRSTADISMEDMSVCIDRFRNWSSKEAGIYLPTAEEGAALAQCEIEIDRARRFL